MIIVIKNRKNVETVEREREREKATFSKIGFICAAASEYIKRKRVDYKKIACNYSLPFLDILQATKRACRIK